MKKKWAMINLNWIEICFIFTHRKFAFQSDSFYFQFICLMTYLWKPWLVDSVLSVLHYQSCPSIWPIHPFFVFFLLFNIVRSLYFLNFCLGTKSWSSADVAKQKQGTKLSEKGEPPGDDLFSRNLRTLKTKKYVLR